MEERNYNDPWDDGVYGTGRTHPPKSRGGIFALLLILVIFLCGIVTMLSIMNVKLFQQLNLQKEESLSISFTPDPTESPELMQEETESTQPMLCAEHSLTIDLHTSPESVENIPQEGGLSLQAIYEKNIDSVVSIRCALPEGTASGTGVIFSRDGYIVTNCHVVEHARSISVLLTDGRDYPAAIVGTDTVSDLAVLYIDAKGLTSAAFGNSDALRVGDAVAAIGDPLGVELRGTMTDGIVSAINREVAVSGRKMTLIQTNTALNSGNSGGPLINCYGQVIGINTLKIGAFVDSAGVEGIGFAIPSTTVKEIVDQLVQQGYVSGRPRLGIECTEVSSYYQQFYRLPAGIRVVSLSDGGPAEAAGLQVGDILLSMDGIRVATLDELNAQLYIHQVGDRVTLTVYRGGKQLELTLTLGERTE